MLARERGKTPAAGKKKDSIKRNELRLRHERLASGGWGESLFPDPTFCYQRVERAGRMSSVDKFMKRVNIMK